MPRLFGRPGATVVSVATAVFLWSVTAGGAETAVGTLRIGPSFDCSKARAPTALMICADAELARLDLRFNQAYWALFQQAGPPGQGPLKDEDLKFIDRVQTECGVPRSGPLTSEASRSRDCVRDDYEKMREAWLARLTGAAREEAVRAPERHLALQRALQQLGFGQPGPIDGVFGPGTRAAIVAWQSARGLATTGLLGDADARRIEAEVTASRLGAGGAAARTTSVPLRFQRVSIDSSGDLPEACFQFSEALDPRAEAHYADYVAVAPAPTPSVRARGSDLCLAGLVYGTDYKVTLRQGLSAVSGARTERDETIDVTLADRPAVVALSGDGFILPRAKGKGLAVDTVNVSRVKIHVLRISERMLSNQIRFAGRRYDLTPVLKSGTMNRYQLREWARNLMSVVWSGTMEVEPDHNRNVETAFPLADIIKPGEVGAYLVVAEDAVHAMRESFFRPKASDEDETFEEEGENEIAAHWVISTDIALTAATAADGLHLFARSLASADPLSGIKLSLLATGQDLLGEGMTDAGGHFVFAPGLMRGTRANAPSSIVAYGPAGDFAILDLHRAAFDLSDRGVSGRPAPGAIEAFLYTERGIYRPGQTVELMALLRDRVGKAIGDMPLTFVLRRPDGVEAKRFAMRAQPEGGFHRPVPLSLTAARGMWTLEAYIDPSGGAVGRVEFDVEDFVPQRLKVTLSTTTPVLRPGQPIGATVEGAFLYGAPAAGLAGEAELRITRDPAPVPAAKDYRFGLAEEKIEDQVQKLTMADADAQGRTKIEDVLEPPAKTTAPLKGILSAGLFDPGGRVVKDQIELPIRAQPLLIGIRPRFTEDRAPEEGDAQFDLRVFDDAGQPVARQNLEWRLIREQHAFDWLETGGSRWTFHYHVVDRPVASGKIDVTETGPAVLSQRVEWGDYRLVVDDPATQVVTSVRFSAGWFVTAELAETPDKVGVTVDKASYAAGAIARVRVEPPFAGKAELTIAGDCVFETRAVTVPKDGATFDVKVSPDWGAGAYAILSLYRPLDQGRAHDPVRAIGVAWLGLDPNLHTLGVAIGTPEKMTPRQHIVVPLKLDGASRGKPTYVTLAAVDEGILQLTRFHTPDPGDFFFGKRRLGLDIRDDYGRLLDNGAAVGPIREGGDTGLGGPVIARYQRPHRGPLLGAGSRRGGRHGAGRTRHSRF